MEANDATRSLAALISRGVLAAYDFTMMGDQPIDERIMSLSQYVAQVYSIVHNSVTLGMSREDVVALTYESEGRVNRLG